MALRSDRGCTTQRWGPTAAPRCDRKRHHGPRCGDAGSDHFARVGVHDPCGRFGRSWGVVSDWRDDFFGEAEAILPSIPFLPVIGNHEENDPLYYAYLQVPSNGDPLNEGHWYYQDYQNVRLIGLDSNDPFASMDQLDWLDAVLADAASQTKIDFVFVQFHHPIKTEFWRPRPNPFGDAVLERLEGFSAASGKPSVHMVGHFHGYSRGQSRDAKHVWLNIASAEGPLAHWHPLNFIDYPEIQMSIPNTGSPSSMSRLGPTPVFVYGAIAVATRWSLVTTN